MLNHKREFLPNAVARELRRLFLLALALVLGLSLLSYSPADPSWTTWTSKTSYQNWMGRSGSTAADICFQLFGLASFILCGLLVNAGLKAREFHERMTKLDIGAVVLLLISIGAVLNTFIPKAWVPWKLPNAGGLTGKFAAICLTYLAGSFGARLLSVLLLVGSSILVFRWQVVSFCTQLAQKLWPIVKAKAVAYYASAMAQTKAFFKRKKASVPPIAAATGAVNPPIVEHKPIGKVENIPAAKQPLLPIVDEEEAPNLDHEIFRVSASKLPARSTTTEKKAKKVNPEDFQLPDVGMLSGRAESRTKAVDRNWYLEKANILVQKLKDFGVEGEVVNISPGPVITVYEFKPASGVKIKEIANLSDDLTLALSVLSVRIVAPIPGKPVVGIEIPSPHREMVHFKDLIQETSFYSPETRIPVVLGRLASGEPVVADLAAMPHVLVAGATGTGKSVFINTLICSLLYRYSPKQLRLILVDPKMVELSSYENIPHLLLPVVVDSKKAAMALRWTVDEMERRYSLMHKFGVRHMEAYNEKLLEMQLRKEPLDETHGHLPYIVVVVDEYADLMAVVPKDVELSIARLAQKARASGIHLVLATQRPSTDVVTGTIKANFPSRISFRVASQVDSKTILDRSGAERLLGSGDLLFHSAGFMSLKRMQGAYIADADIERVVTFLKAQGEPEFDERILKAQELPEEGLDGGPSSGDSEEARLYDQAVRLVTEKGEASISLIQRHLRIGYNRAASLMEQMEKEGIVSAETGTSKRRTVIAGAI